MTNEILPTLYVAFLGTNAGYAPTQLAEALSHEAVEAYIAALHWGEHSTNYDKTYVAANIRAFAAQLRTIARGPDLSASRPNPSPGMLNASNIGDSDIYTKVAEAFNAGNFPDQVFPSPNADAIPPIVVGADFASKEEFKPKPEWKQKRPPPPPSGWQRVLESGDYFRVVGGELKTITATELTEFEKANHGKFRGMKIQGRLDQLYMGRAGIDEATFKTLTAKVEASPTPSNLVDDV